MPVIIIGTGIQLAAHAAPDQLLNGILAAALFNVIYDALLARGLRAYTLCPFIDFMNHSSTAGVGSLSPSGRITALMSMLNDIEGPF